MLEDFPDTVQLVDVPFPAIDNPSSLLAALAALAAHAQGRFWEFRQTLFRLADPVSPDALRTIAEQLDMDVPRLFHDLSPPEIQRLPVHGINDGLGHGVTGTPTVMVNRTLLLPLCCKPSARQGEDRDPRWQASSPDPIAKLVVL